jgi:hypothetical protein
MKKILTLVAAITLATTTFSQWSIHAGGNISQFAGADNTTGSTKFGYQIGFTTYSNKLFSIQPGVYLINKGAKEGKTAVSLNYLQIPVNFLLGYNITEEFRLVAGAGLYAGLGLWGSEKHDGQNKKKIEFFNQNDKYKALDLGWQFVIGGQWNRYGVRLSYQPGFTKVMGNPRYENGKVINYKEPGPREYNNSFTFSVSYTLGNMEGTPPRR